MAAIAVDQGSLRTGSHEVRAAADLLGRTFDSRAGDLSVSGPAAWSMVSMTATATGVWGSYLRELRASVAASADGLSAMAQIFAAAEWQAARLPRGGGAFVE